MKRILHIASFNGNIGDQANHSGFRKSLKEYLDEDFEFTNLEIRKFYKNWNELHFDESFVRLANQHDLVIIGGGGFFEICWDYSATGTTIDVTENILNQVTTPIIFNGVGLRLTNKSTKEQIDKFLEFLKYCVRSENILVTLRNDGSYKNLVDIGGKQFIDGIIKIPDGGFFVDPPQYLHYEINENEDYITINLAGDDLENRFGDGHTYIRFVKSVAKILENVLVKYPQFRIIFVAHIFADYKIMLDVLENIEDKYKRTRIGFSSCYSGVKENELLAFDLYKDACLSLGMRYHANVCPIGMNVPTIGISTEERLNDLYEDIGMPNRCVDVRCENYEEKIQFLIDDIILNQGKYINENKKLNDRLCLENAIYMSKIREFIS